MTERRVALESRSAAGRLPSPASNSKKRDDATRQKLAIAQTAMPNHRATATELILLLGDGLNNQHRNRDDAAYKTQKNRALSKNEQSS